MAVVIKEIKDSLSMIFQKFMRSLRFHK